MRKALLILVMFGVVAAVLAPTAYAMDSQEAHAVILALNLDAKESQKVADVLRGIENCQPVTAELQFGSEGEQVVALQKFLEDRGYFMLPYKVAKGYFGEKTYGALRAYQMSEKLAVTGVADAETRAAIAARCAPLLPKPGSLAVAGAETAPAVIEMINRYYSYLSL